MKKIILLSLTILFISAAFSQGNMKTRKWRKTEIDSLGKAQAMFEDQNYLMALPVFDQLQQSHPKELYLKYVTGICGLYRSDTHAKSLDFLLFVYAKNRKAADIEYDIARADHYNYKFDDALGMLDRYLKHKKLTDLQKKNAEQLREYCNNAKILVAAPVDAKIENIGDIVNTVGSEYVPVVSSDESVMIFTYRGDQSTGGLQNDFNQPDALGSYYEDVFITHKENGNWVAPASIGSNINTNAHDAAIGISNDGQKLFIFKDDSYDGGDIYMSKLDSNSWSAPEKLKGDVNTSAWEGSASLSADEKTLYFSSEWPGGFGGKDLYKATLKPDGTWGNVKNLGSTVNTKLDDDAPFIHPDGRTLIYSSKGLNSMGGYDIFTTQLNADDSTWSTPKNIGYPINTPDEDIYFVLSVDGKNGYYASGKEGGYGLQDIYKVDMPDNSVKPIVAMVKGFTTLDDKPVETIVQVDMTDNNKEYGTFQSNAVYGNYLVNLMSGHNYKLTYKLKGFADQIQNVDATNLTAFLEKDIDIKFSKKADSLALIKRDSVLSKTDTSKSTISDVVGKVGNSTKEGLEFKVQIAAYNVAKNYKYDYLKKNLVRLKNLCLKMV